MKTLIINHARRGSRQRTWWAPWHRRDRHDPLLVLNMSIFNSGGDWNRIFNPIPSRENVWS